MSKLMVKGDNGRYRVAESDEVLEYASQILRDSCIRKGQMTSPNKTAEFLKVKMAQHKSEVFAAIFLDNRHRVIEYEELFRGTIDGASVHPREMVKRSLHHNAAAVILAHNHPSGLPEPSEADKRITGRLKDALALIDVRVLDHVVVAGNDHYSMAEGGML